MREMEEMFLKGRERKMLLKCANKEIS